MATSCSVLDQERLVTDWLKTVFSDEPVPKFNKTPEFIAQLYDLMLRHTALQQSIEVYRTFSNASREDLVSDEKEVATLLTSCGIDGMLENPTLEGEQLSKLAHTLSLSNTDESSYILALSHISLDKEQTTSKYELYKRSVCSKERDLTSVISTAKQLEQMLTSERQMETDSRKNLASQESQVPFLSRKISKYESDKRQYDRALNGSQLRSDMTHDKLVESYNELESLRCKLDETNKQLAMYADLPPDRELAKVKLAVAKAELQELEDTLVRQCDLYHL